MLHMDKQITRIIPTYSSNMSQENVFTFGKNSLKAYPKSNNITFNLLPHLELDEEQKCIINNLWISFNQIFSNQINKNLDIKYFITCLNSLSEYLHKGNNGSTNFSFYVIYQGHEIEVFKTWEEVLPNISNHPTPFFKGFYDLIQALDQYKSNIGNNYFISPLVKTYFKSPWKILFESCRTQTKKTFDLVNDFSPLPSQYHLLREEFEILRNKYVNQNKIIKL